MTMDWSTEVWQAVKQDFSDIPDVAVMTRIVMRLLLATCLGAALGFERESAGSSAGLRTHILVALGSALFVLVPLEASMSIADLSRVLQGLIAGVGFLGAGAILKRSNSREIQGLTTAANIWVTAAIGVGVGMGREMTAIVSTVFALIVLAGLKRLKPPPLAPVERRVEGAGAAEPEQRGRRAHGDD